MITTQIVEKVVLPQENDDFSKINCRVRRPR